MSLLSLWIALVEVSTALLGNVAGLVSTAEVVDAADLPSFNLPGSGGPFGWPDIPGLPPPLIPGPGPNDDDDGGDGPPGWPGWPPDGPPSEDPEPPEPPEECEE